MNKVIKKLTDVITIIGPAISAVLAALGMMEILPIFDKWYGTTIVVLGAISSISSVVYNAVTEEGPKEAIVK